jgi:Rab GDP dissociation inhibitor
VLSQIFGRRVDTVVMNTGKRVLHVDRNNYYGADTASLSLQNLFEKFRGSEPPASLGHPRNWNVDLIPKFIMACGKLVKILLHTKVTRYLDFKSIDGSYVYKDGKVQKVPATPAEALNSSLMGFFEKRKFRNFLIFLAAYEKDKPATYFKGKTLDRVTMRELYAEYGLDANTQAFTGHAMALQTDDDYLDQPAAPTAEAIQLYVYSLERYGKSPYIYPLYGLGGLPEGFSRLCAIHGGTFMLNKSVDRVSITTHQYIASWLLMYSFVDCVDVQVLFDEGGRAWGIQAGNEIAKATQIIGDPSYFPGKSRVVGQVIRTICLLDHPIDGTERADSVQIIIPASQVRRRNDIYVAVVSSAHNVSAPGTYIAIVSTTVETAQPQAEIQPGIALLGKILERCV